jgi:hypothetical protein
MERRRTPALVAAILASLLVVVPAVGLGTSGHSLAGSRDGDAREQVGVVGPDPVSYANFSIGISPPHANETVPPGSVIMAEYRFEVLNFTSQDENLFVRVPGTVAVFDETGGAQLKIASKAQSFTVTGPGYSSADTVQNSTQLSAPTNFNHVAVYSSQLVGVMDSLPTGSVTLQFQWQWTVTAPGVAPVNSTWESGISSTLPGQVVPVEYVQLWSTSPKSMLVPQPFTVCLAGAVEGENFSLDAVELAPNVGSVQSNASISPTAPLPFCWSVAIPAWATPQDVQVLVSGYSAAGEAVLLYVVSPVVLTGAVPPTPEFLGVPLSEWLSGITIGAVVAAVAIVAYIGVRYLRSRSK